MVRFLGGSINLVMQEWLGTNYAILELKVPILLKKDRRASVSKRGARVAFVRVEFYPN